MGERLEVAEKVILPILTFVAGFLIRTWIPTSKERFDIRAKQAQTSRDLLKERQGAYQAFVGALQEMQAAEASGAAERVEQAYWSLRKQADLYFAVVDMIASYIRRGDIDPRSTKQDHLDDLVKIAGKAIPGYFQTVARVAAKHGLPQSDALGAGTCRNLRLLLKTELTPEGYLALCQSWGISEGEIG